MTYRADHVTQKDGGVNQWNNCRMAVGATQLDYHTKGAKTTTGSKLRLYQDDQQGGTDADDLRRAWERGYDETLVIRNGRYWDDLVADRAKGWFVGIDVWYATISDRCQTAASFGHTMGVAPETDERGWWLVSDPLCAGYKWMDPATIRKAMEDWGRRILNTGIAHPPIYYTTSVPEWSDDDMDTINTSGYVSSKKLARVKVGSAWYFDSKCAEKGNTFSTARAIPFIGATQDATRAVLVSTGQPYEDKVARATIVYMRTADITLEDAPNPPTSCDDAVKQRDAEWIAHLTPSTP